MIKYVLKNLKLSKKLYFPMMIFSLIMSGLISLAVFMYNSTKSNAIEYAKIMGDLDLGIYYTNERRNDFYNAVQNLDLEDAGIEKIVGVPMVIGDLSVNGVLLRQNSSPISYLHKLSQSDNNKTLESGEILVSKTMKNAKIGDSVTYIYENSYGEICSNHFVIKDFYYVNDILANTIILSESDFHKVFGNSKPYYFSIYAKNSNDNLLSMAQFQEIYEKLSSQLKDFENDYFISFFSQSIYNEISRFIHLIEIAVGIVIIIIMLLEFSLSITIFISLLDVRKTDLGMFLAFGMNKRKISIMFSIESFIISFIGTILGIGISVVAAYFARYINIEVNNYILKIVSEQFVHLVKYFNWKNIVLPVIFSNVVPTLIYFAYEKHQINKNISNLINEK